MPVQLLPASAAAFSPRGSVNVVLGSKVEPWLTQTLKRINKVKRPLNSVPQHQRCLTETLSSPNAIWTLTSIMLTKAPDAELSEDTDMFIQAFSNYKLVHVEAYAVHVDMVLRNEVAFKLTKESIDTLVEYHKDVHCPNTKASTYDWSEKEQQCKKLHEDFVQAINKFVFRTHVSALEGLEEEGAGELLCGKSEEVKNSIMGLMKALLPPPPRVVDVMRQASLLPSSPGIGLWSQPAPAASLPAVDAWRILPSSPSVVSSSAESTPTTTWATIGMPEPQVQSPHAQYLTPYTTAGYFFSAAPAVAPIPALPLPSMLSPPCGVGMGFGGFGWDRMQEYTTTI